MSGCSLRTVLSVIALFATGLAVPSACRAENLIQDGSSFEAGLDGCALGMLAGRLHGESASVVLEIDRTTAAHGQCSLKFVRPANCRLSYGLFYKPVALRPGRDYTLSAYLKGSRDGAQAGLSLFGSSVSQPGRPGLRPQTQMFQLTRAWARYELRIANLFPSAPVEGDAAANLYYVVVHSDNSGAMTWIDGVQLEEGAATPFSTGKALELAVSSNRPGNQFWAGEEIVPQVDLYAPDVKVPTVVSYRATDVLGAEVAAASQDFRVPPDGHLMARLPGFSLTHRGWVTITVTASCGGHEEKEYLNVAALNKLPQPVPDQVCQFGFNYNSVTTPDNLGAANQWHPSNIGLNLDRVFRLAQHAGARWLRAADIILWDSRRGAPCCEIAPGKFVFYDEGVKAMKSYGLELIGTLANANAHEDFSPEWARSGQVSRLAPIPTQEAWRRYVRTMVGHYKDQIKYWEIINEPNTGFWPKDYVPLMIAAYEEAKKADPNCMVIGICATADQEGDPYGYVRAVAEAGGLKSLDIVSGHAFCKTRPWMCRSEGPSWDYFTEMAAILKKFDPSRTLPLWNTEGVKYCCWSDRPNVPHTTTEFAIRYKGRNASVSQRLAAAYVVRDCAIEFCGGVRVLFLWQFRNEAVDFNLSSAESLGSVDFFSPDGTPQAKFVALNALADKLRGAKPVEHFGLSPRVRCAVFDSPPGPFAIVWRENENETDLHSYTLPVRTTAEVQDMLGRPVKTEPSQGALNVKISECPTYLVGVKNCKPSDLVSALKEAGQQVQFTHDSPLKNPNPIRPRRQRPDESKL